MPLHFRGAVAPVLQWLKSLPKTELDARPALWVIYASALSMAGQNVDIEEKLQAAEAALQGAVQDERTRDLVGHIAAIRATVAATQYQVETIITQSRRALEYLHPDNLAARTGTTLTLGYAYQLQGDRPAARRTYTQAIAISQASGHAIITVLATLGLGNIQEAENQLPQAAQTYQHVLHLLGEPPLPVAGEAHLGLARICYEWNDLDAALAHGQRGVQLARLIENADRFVAGEVLLARLRLAQGNPASAAALLAQAERSARQRNFLNRMPEIAAARVLTFLHQGNLAAAAHLAQTHDLPIGKARVHLAQGDTSTALALLEQVHSQAEAHGWEDERLKVMVLQVLALQACGETDAAIQLLADALSLAEPGGCIRLFVDEGLPMSHLVSTAAARGLMPDYSRNLLSAFHAGERKREGTSHRPAAAPGTPGQAPIEPLSQREVEVLQLIAQGRSNREISERLFVALDTVKGHNRNIFSKLQVQRRTEAVARARDLGVL